jgi:hypothetical protein
LFSTEPTNHFLELEKEGKESKRFTVGFITYLSFLVPACRTPGIRIIQINKDRKFLIGIFLETPGHKPIFEVKVVISFQIKQITGPLEKLKCLISH